MAKLKWNDIVWTLPDAMVRMQELEAQLAEAQRELATERSNAKRWEYASNANRDEAMLQQDRALKAERERDEARKLSQWTEITSETIPKKGEIILFVTSEGVIETGWLVYDETELIFQCERTDPQDEPITFRVEDGYVTHWMHLPNAPTQEAPCGKS